MMELFMKQKVDMVFFLWLLMLCNKQEQNRTFQEVFKGQVFLVASPHQPSV